MEGRADALLVLVVEDDPDLCDLVTTILELGLSVRTAKAEDGEQGLILARKLRPNLVLLDIRLPRIGGLEVARRLKADPLTRAIPLVAMTSEPSRATLAAGCDDHVGKPFDVLDLIGKAERYLGPSPQAQPTA